MDLQQQILAEHSRRNTDLMAAAIGNNPEEYRNLWKLLLTAEAPIPQRVSWLFFTLADRYPELAHPYLGAILEKFNDFQHDGIRRNLMHILSQSEIPKKLQGKAVELCFELILSSEEFVAVKVLSLQTLANIAEKERELIPEITAVIEDQLPKTTAAFAARARHVLKKFNSYASKSAQKRPTGRKAPSGR